MLSTYTHTNKKQIAQLLSYIHIHTCRHTHMHTNIHRTRRHLHTQMHACASAYICISTSISLSINIYIYICVYVHIYTHTCVCIYKCAHIYKYICLLYTNIYEYDMTVSRRCVGQGIIWHKCIGGNTALRVARCDHDTRQLS